MASEDEGAAPGAYDALLDAIRAHDPRRMARVLRARRDLAAARNNEPAWVAARAGSFRCLFELLARFPEVNPFEFPPGALTPGGVAPGTPAGRERAAAVPPGGSAWGALADVEHGEVGAFIVGALRGPPEYPPLGAPRTPLVEAWIAANRGGGAGEPPGAGGGASASSGASAGASASASDGAATGASASAC